MGIKQEILSAANKTQIDQILGKAASFTDATAKTRRQWARAAESRLRTLAEQAPKPERKGKKDKANA